MFVNERLAQLDESFKGKEKFIGDGMMISDLTKNRKLQKEYGDKVNQKKMNIIEINDELVNEKILKKERGKFIIFIIFLNLVFKSKMVSF